MTDTEILDWLERHCDGKALSVQSPYHAVRDGVYAVGQWEILKPMQAGSFRRIASGESLRDAVRVAMQLIPE